MKKTLAVAAIENGTVIDHLPADQALQVASLLSLSDHSKRVTLGLNLPSRSLRVKGLIKIEGREITEEEANQIAVFAPKATISIIRDFEVVKKFPVELPNILTNVFKCPNSCCITNHESITPHFNIAKQGNRITLSCHFCEKSFSHDTH